MRRFAPWPPTIACRVPERVAASSRPASSSAHLSPDWQERLGDVFNRPYMRNLRSFLKKRRDEGKVTYPPARLVFNALNLTPFDRVTLVVLGQDPYHNPDQAHGLCFSVPRGVQMPPSLQNIFKELEADLGIKRTETDLSDWAEQGVLLLNSVLTVEAHKAASHAGKGWEQFTDLIINMLAREHDNLAFILWGAYAKKKAQHVDRKRHFVLESPHPSPLSAEKGFFGSQPFSRVNAFLQVMGKSPINW